MQLTSLQENGKSLEFFLVLVLVGSCHVSLYNDLKKKKQKKTTTTTTKTKRGKTTTLIWDMDMRLRRPKKGSFFAG
jgi:hypothetical protein